MRPLTRAALGRPAPPVRLVHLGLGNFVRAHAAAYTDDLGDDAWGFAGFGGRVHRRPDGSGTGPGPLDRLAAQGGLYTLLERGPDVDRASVMGGLSEVWPADAGERWRSLVASPEVVAVTLTVTEAGHGLGPDGTPDLGRPELVADVAALRAGSDPVSAPGRLVDGLRARRDGGTGALAVVPLDNLAANGRATAAVVGALATAVDPSVAAWVQAHVSFVSTVVDRITPRAAPADRAAAAALTGWDDAAVVVTEPFREWVLCGAFPAGRPPWERAGAAFVDDTGPYEARKLLLLNGAHSLLAYLGLARGHATVAGALADDEVAQQVQAWWDEASPLVPLPAADLAAYRDRLRERFANPRMAHRLEQVAADGSQKLPVRVLPVVRAARAAGRVPPAAATTLAAWIAHVGAADGPGSLTDAAAPALLDAREAADPVRALLAVLGPDLADDGDLVAAVTEGVAAVQAGEVPG